MSARTTVALARTALLFRYALASVVEDELAHWRASAGEIQDAGLRGLAQDKLAGEGENARAAAMLATLVPGGQRAGVARTIVATEVLFDYLDGRTEPAPAGDPVAGRLALYDVFSDAVSGLRPSIRDEGDGTYLAALARRIGDGLCELPGWGSAAAQIRAAGARAGEAQAHSHAVRELGTGRLRQWATRGAGETRMGWREYAAGASASVLCVHALIAGAAGAPGHDNPQALDRAYLQLAVVAKLLDDLVDGEPGRYASAEELGEATLVASAKARTLLRALGSRHLAVHAGLVAHYASSPGLPTQPAVALLKALAQGQRSAVSLARLALGSSAPRKALALAQPTPTGRASDEPAAG